jgi:dTDP-glucose pyrophosphorylase
VRAFEQHLIREVSSIKEALARLDELAEDAILFVINIKGVLIGSLTDGDVRRGILKGFGTEDLVRDFYQTNPKFIRRDSFSIQEVIDLRNGLFGIVPVIDENKKVVNIVNFRVQQSYLPVDAVIMAGGIGSRLKPLTDNTPKPLLKVGNKTIIDHNIDRLRKFGITNFWVSVRYLGEQLEHHFNSSERPNTKVAFVWEDKPLGTIGCVSSITNFEHDYVLITNSDLLTTMDYEDFFQDFIEKDADMSVATIPYHVNIPYAVIETDGHNVTSFKEKPRYTFYSNGGIYLVKKKTLELLPQNEFFNSTDLMESVLAKGMKLISYPNNKYWIDIGKHQDFEKAQEDIRHLNL